MVFNDFLKLAIKMQLQIVESQNIVYIFVLTFFKSLSRLVTVSKYNLKISTCRLITFLYKVTYIA